MNESNLSHTHPPLSPVSSCGQSHYSRTLCRNTGKCVTHADPALDRQRDARAGSLRSPSLPHRGYVGGSVGVTSTVLGGLASASQPVSLAPPYHQTRLCDSVRPASLETSHCQLFYSLTEGTLGTDALAHSWPRGLRKYAFPPVSLQAQTLCKVREEDSFTKDSFTKVLPTCELCNKVK